MNALDFASFTTIGEETEAFGYEEYIDLEEQFKASWDKLGHDFFNTCPERIVSSMNAASQNPLCIALTSTVLVVMGVRLVRYLILFFSERG